MAARKAQAAARATKKPKARTAHPATVKALTREIKSLSTRYPKYTGLDEDEQAYLNGLIDEGRLPLIEGARAVAATFYTQDDFTIARLHVWRGDKRSKAQEMMGVTKRNVHDDEYVWERAAKIALARAARNEAEVA